MQPKPQTNAAAAIVEAPAGQRKKAPAPIQQKLWERSGGRCEFLAADGKRCGSTHALEIDHIQSLALGGSNSLSNLRLVCRIHNGFLAKEAFGSAWMGQFLPRLKSQEP